MKHWLMKSEPDTFGIADLARVGVEPWNGVRSVFARFHMRQMEVGDEVLFHHSSVDPPGVAGLARVVRTKVIDETQFDPASPYHDPKATREKPIWDCVDVAYVSTFPYFVTMDRMRAEPALADMVLFRQGRLSVQPVTEAEFRCIVAMGHEPPPADFAEKLAAGRQAHAKARAARRAAWERAQAAKLSTKTTGSGRATKKTKPATGKTQQAKPRSSKTARSKKTSRASPAHARAGHARRRTRP